MHPSWPASAWILGAALVASGCVGGEANSPAAAPGAPSGQPITGAETGVLNVLVADDSLAPIEGAQVGLLEAKMEAATDDAGRAVLAELDPGTYTAVAQKLGYESSAKKVQITAGQATEVVFQLVSLPAVEAYHNTFIFRGHITCGAGLIVVRLITVCGTTGTGTPAGNLTVDPNH